MIHNNIFYRKTNHKYKNYKAYLGLHNGLERSYKEYKQIMKGNQLFQQVITDKLSEYIGNLPEEQHKKLILNFKRDLYNDRGNIRKKHDSVSEILSPGLNTEISSYLDMKDEENCREEKFYDTFEQTYLKEKSHILKDLQQDNHLLLQTKLINPSIYSKLLEMVNTEPENHNKKQRKMDNFLYNYYSRVYLKPSPFAELASTGSIKLDEGGKAPTNDENHEHMSVNHAIIMAGFEKFTMNLDVMKTLTYRLNETIIQKEGKYYFTIFTSSDKGSLYKNRQSLSTIKKNKYIDELLNAYSDKKVMTWNQIATYLPVEIANEYIYKLIFSGALIKEQKLLITDQHKFINSFIKLIPTIDKYKELINILKEIDMLEQQRFSWDNFNKLTKVVGEFIAFLGLINFKEEDYVLVDSLVVKDTSNNKQAIECIKNKQQNFNELAEFIGIFDISTRCKMNALKILNNEYNGYFVPKDARELSEFLRKLSSQLFINDDYWLESFGYFDMENEHNLNDPIFKIKQKVIEYLMTKYEKAHNHINFSKEFVEKCNDDLKRIVGELHKSRAFFTQVSEQDIVINHIYKGYGVYNRRFQYYRHNSNPSYGTDGELYDIPMSFGFNANIRLMSPNTLELPIGENYHLGKNNIRWLDIGFRTSKKSQEIEMFNLHTGNVIYPNFLGSLITVALPSLVAVFNAITLNDSIYFDFGDVLLRNIIANGKDAKEIIKTPRITFINEQFILSRKKFYIPTHTLKGILSTKEDVSSQWLKVKAYFKENALPEDFYIKDIFLKYDKNSEVLKDKPQYININSVLSFKLFKKIILKKEAVVFEEPKPISPKNANDYVTEYIVETND